MEKTAAENKPKKIEQMQTHLVFPVESRVESELGECNLDMVDASLELLLCVAGLGLE